MSRSGDCDSWAAAVCRFLANARFAVVIFTQKGFNPQCRRALSLMLAPVFPGRA